MRIGETGEEGKQNESEVGMKRRRGGIILSWRLGADGRVFARVYVCWLCVFSFTHFSSGTMPVCWQGTRKSNPTEVWVHHFSKVAANQVWPLSKRYFCYRCVSSFSRLVKTSLETITSRISRTMVYTQVRQKVDSKSSTLESCVCLASVRYFTFTERFHCFKYKTVCICSLCCVCWSSFQGPNSNSACWHTLHLLKLFGGRRGGGVRPVLIWDTVDFNFNFCTFLSVTDFVGQTSEASTGTASIIVNNAGKGLKLFAVQMVSHARNQDCMCVFSVVLLFSSSLCHSRSHTRTINSYWVTIARWHNICRHINTHTWVRKFTHKFIYFSFLSSKGLNGYFSGTFLATVLKVPV